MKASMSAILVLLILPSFCYAQNCSFPDEIAGTWLYRAGNSDNDKKLELNAENYTEMAGDERETYNCLMSVPENTTFIAKTVNDDQTASYKCFAYKKINNNVLIGYTSTKENPDDAPTDVYVFCGDLLKYPTPGKVYYNADDLNAVQCSITGKYEWKNDECTNTTSKLEVCSGGYDVIEYTEGCNEVQAPFINGSMDCLASWENNDGLKYSLAQTAEEKEGDSSQKGNYICIAHKLVNNTLRLTARDFQCQASQTDIHVGGDGLTAQMTRVSEDGECGPPDTSEGAIHLSAGFSIAMSFIVVAITAWKA